MLFYHSVRKFFVEMEKKNEGTFDEDGECINGEIERSASARAGARDVGLSYDTRYVYAYAYHENATRA